MNDDTLPAFCATCGKSLDALRAARVRFTENDQWFFCSAAHADEFEADQDKKKKSGTLRPPSQKLPLPPPPPAPPPLRGPPPSTGLLEAPLPYSPLATDTSESGPKTQTVRVSRARARGDGSEVVSPLDAFGTWAPALVTMVGALFAAATGEPFENSLAAALLLGFSMLWGRRQVIHWQIQATRSRARYRERLEVEGQRLTSSGPIWVPESSLRPGEEVVVEAGQFVPADGTVAEGSAHVEMWEGATGRVHLLEGDLVVAGAEVITGKVHVVCTKTGKERAFSPLLEREARPLSTRVQMARISHRMAREGALAVASIGGALYLFQGASIPTSLSAAGMIWGSLAHPIARALPGVIAARLLNRAAREGICFSHEHLVDRAGTVTIAAFCARGTVLHGEPEVAEVHPLRDTEESELLSLAAGAESVVHHPVAAAVLRAARTRSIQVDSCRGHNAVRGMGVRCVSSKGDQLILGSRELLLREKVAIAMAEDTLRGLESRGLTALMLAQNSHLIGVIALQDSLRAGAKAAIQVLLDERIEPVLMSGDSRATTEAVAHALAVEHVRPEIPASGRAQEITSLIEGGATVAVIGTSPRDDAALGAAPIPIVLDGAAVSWRDAKHGKERAIGLGGRHVLAAPLALVTARRIRMLGIRALLFTLLPTGVAVATAIAFLAPLYLPPLVAALGAALASRLSLPDSNASLGGY